MNSNTLMLGRSAGGVGSTSSNSSSINNSVNNNNLGSNSGSNLSSHALNDVVVVGNTAATMTKSGLAVMGSGNERDGAGIVVNRGRPRLPQPFPQPLVRLTAKPHAFAGAVLSPRHAQELTPSLCLAIASAMAQQQQQQILNNSVHSSSSVNSSSSINSSAVNHGANAAGHANVSHNSHNSHNNHAFAKRGTPTTTTTGTLSSTTNTTNNLSTNTCIPYTLWITEAWRVLGWAEPSAALFWEMATMYHTLVLVNRSYYHTAHSTQSTPSNHPNLPNHSWTDAWGPHQQQPHPQNQPLFGHSSTIPPILSSGSTSSVGSATINSTVTTVDTTALATAGVSNSRIASSASSLLQDKPGTTTIATTTATLANTAISAATTTKKFATTTSTTSVASATAVSASAKELPLWLVGTFLLLHCEEYAYYRNLAGQMDRNDPHLRFFASGLGGPLPVVEHHSPSTLASSLHTKGDSKVDFASLMKHQSSMSPRSRVHHPIWNTSDHHHCTAFLLRHLRKILLLSAASHNPDAMRACMHIAAIPPPPTTTSTTSSSTTGLPAFPSIPAGGPLINSMPTTNSPSITSKDRTHNNTNIHSKSRPNALAVGLAITSETSNRPSAGGTASSIGAGNNGSGGTTKYSANELRRQHDSEHGNVGLNVRLTMDDLDHLDFVLQLPSGGGIDDPPIRIGEYLWTSLYRSASLSSSSSLSSNAIPPLPTSIPLVDVEREIRQHLETELTVTGFDSCLMLDDKEELLTDYGEDDSIDTNTNAVGGSTINVPKKQSSTNTSTTAGAAQGLHRERAKQPNNHYHKELSYTHLRGTTIVLKPNPQHQQQNQHQSDTGNYNLSSGASTTSSIDGMVDGINGMSAFPQTGVGGLHSASNCGSSSGRLHDLVISDCSDAHFYLLQPFEHATIASTSNCTIVVGAVAGLLHVVDCEKTYITAAARRIVVGNSNDVQLCVFSPSPPLLVGDNRSCQLAPYNTYYDGIHDDLIVTGLAAPAFHPASAIPDIATSPYHGTNASRNVIAASNHHQSYQSHQPFHYDNHDSSSNNTNLTTTWQPLLQKASNKWKHPIELSKLEVPQVPGSPATAAGATVSATGVLSNANAGGGPSTIGGIAGGGSMSHTNSSSSLTLSPGADDKAMSVKTGTGADASLHPPILLPPTDFNILFVPIESEASRQRRRAEADAAATKLSAGGSSSAATLTSTTSATGNSENTNPKDLPTTVTGATTASAQAPSTASPISNTGGSGIFDGGESQYCRLLADVLQLSPFRLPAEYERRVLLKAERMKNIQLAVQKHLSASASSTASKHSSASSDHNINNNNNALKRRFEDELNRGFRDWLVTSGNLRQVLDLVHLERRGGV